MKFLRRIIIIRKQYYENIKKSLEKILNIFKQIISFKHFIS